MRSGAPHKACVAQKRGFAERLRALRSATPHFGAQHCDLEYAPGLMLRVAFHLCAGSPPVYEVGARLSSLRAALGRMPVLHGTDSLPWLFGASETIVPLAALLPFVTLPRDSCAIVRHFDAELRRLRAESPVLPPEYECVANELAEAQRVVEQRARTHRTLFAEKQ